MGFLFFFQVLINTYWFWAFLGTFLYSTSYFPIKLSFHLVHLILVGGVKQHTTEVRFTLSSDSCYMCSFLMFFTHFTNQPQFPLYPSPLFTPSKPLPHSLLRKGEIFHGESSKTSTISWGKSKSPHLAFNIMLPCISLDKYFNIMLN